MTRREPARIAAGAALLEGMLELPATPIGVVLFAHGSGSSRHSPRNKLVAARLREAGIATLLIDLLGPDEDRDAGKRFDIPLLTARLALAAAWLGTEPLPLGLFGASTGAAAALQLAARDGSGIAAVVSRGGRPDLAGADALKAVIAPTLLTVGGADGAVVDLNRQALAALRCDKRLLVVPGATHLFEEAGKLEEVAQAACDWFVRHLVAP
ncbi:dienelactone hydrolase family protein [Massilia sp. UMI-21]|nr:dienelactone hydrolase family protein [Massilia sp. UMI-21]